jgi:Rhs element Vgr protein
MARDNGNADQRDLISFRVLLNGARMPDVYGLTELQVHKQVNRISSARLTLLDGSGAEGTFAISESASFVPGAEIEIRAGYHGSDASLFKGVVVRHAIKVKRGGGSFISVTCFDKALKLTLGRKSAYLGKTDSEIFSDLITAAGLEASVTATTAQHDPVVRYYGTDWDFLVSRAELNGQIVTVEAGSVTVGPPKLDAQPELTVRYGDTLIDFDAEIDGGAQPSGVECSAWDHAGQALSTANGSEPSLNEHGNLSGKQLASALGLPSHALQSCAPLSSGQLQQWADAQLLKARLARLRGSFTFDGDARAAPGKTIKLDGLGARFNGNAFISSVTHRVQNGDWTSEVGFGMAATWFGEQHADMAPPQASGWSGGVPGLQIAKVRQIDQDPDGQTRVLVDLPAIGLEGDGVWCRLASGYATEQGGIFFVPELEDEVVLGFLNGDPAYPVVLGSLYSSQRTPPYEADAPNTNKAIVTKAQLKISMDDVKKITRIETPGGHVVTLSDEEQTLTLLDSNGNQLQLAPGGVTLDSVGDISITAKTNITIKAGADLSMKGVNISSKASAQLQGDGQAGAELTSTAVVKVQGALVKIN